MYRKLLLSLFGVVGLSVLTFSCGDDKEDEEETASTSLKYSNVSSFINDHCATSGCHASATGSNGNIDLSSHAAVKTNAAKSVTSIENGSMPQAGAEKTSFDSEATGKANLLEYLKGGAPE